MLGQPPHDHARRILFVVVFLCFPRCGPPTARRERHAVKRPPLDRYAEFPFEWVTPRELARKVDCDVRTIRRMIVGGSIGAYRVGRNWRIPIDLAARAFPEHRRTA